MRGIILISAVIAVVSGFNVNKEYHEHPSGYGNNPPPPYEDNNRYGKGAAPAPTPYADEYGKAPPPPPKAYKDDYGKAPPPPQAYVDEYEYGRAPPSPLKPYVDEYEYGRAPPSPPKPYVDEYEYGSAPPPSYPHEPVEEVYENSVYDKPYEEEYDVRPFSPYPDLQDYWTRDEDRVVPPSYALSNGYIPREIMHFRDTFKVLRNRYPDLPLLAPEDLGYDYQPKKEKIDNGRDGRFMGLGSLLFGSLLPFAVPFGGGGGGGGLPPKKNLPNPLNNPLNNKLPNPATNTNNNTAAYEYGGPAICRNGKGTCESYESCLSNGGHPVGQCSVLDEDRCCCQYAFDSDATTSASIFFLRSPGFPHPVRSSESFTVSLVVRPDVDQILVEFVSFELAVGPTGCSELEYVEIIAPTYAGGLLGPGNSRLCGLNTDQHLYLDVNPRDTIIFKVVLSGQVVKFDEIIHTQKKKKIIKYNYRTEDSRFKMKITQLLSPCLFDEELTSYGYKNIAPPVNKGYECIPEYYLKLRAPKNCLQYYGEIRGTFMNFNYDGKTCMPPNLDYKICFTHPENYCGMSLSALDFDVPSISPKCMDGKSAVDGVYPCCTGANERSGQLLPGYVQKFIGLDGYSDGNTRGISYVPNQMRYFFCGSNFGRTNFVVTEARGPMVVSVFSGPTPCTQCEGYEDQGTGVGFKIKYNINLGHC
jgi:hypothetical protein